MQRTTLPKSLRVVIRFLFITLLDFSTVFETVGHHIRLDRLQNYFSISGSDHDWVWS